MSLKKHKHPHRCPVARVHISFLFFRTLYVLCVQTPVVLIISQKIFKNHWNSERIGKLKDFQYAGDRTGKNKKN